MGRAALLPFDEHHHIANLKFIACGRSVVICENVVLLLLCVRGAALLPDNEHHHIDDRQVHRLRQPL